MDHVREKPLVSIPPEGLLLDAAAPLPTVALQLREVDPALDGVVIDGVLTREECARVVEAAEKGGFTFWDPAGDGDERARRVRSASTVEFRAEGFCGELWERLRPFVPSRCAITEEQDRCEPDIEGEWCAGGLNTHLLINRYAAGGHFSPHADGSTIVDFNLRSLYTVLVYLNDCADGGATQILRDEQAAATELDGDLAVARAGAVLHAVQPRAGRALLYWHQTLHAGERVGAGCLKYSLRSDVMYRRDPPMCTAPEDVEAFEAYQRGALLESCGRCGEAVEMYRRARRLSPTLARIYGIM